MNVLIADDNTTSFKLLRALLESESHAVIVAADGQDFGRLRRPGVPGDRRIRIRTGVFQIAVSLAAVRRVWRT